MDTAEHHRDLTQPAWRRWLLLAALALLGALYVGAFVLFATRSQDFLVARYNQRALDFGRAHPASAPSKLTFGLGEHDNARLGGGWHAPDAGGAWSQSTNAFIEIVVPARRPALMLRLNTTVFVAPRRPRMKLKVFINGLPAGKLERGTSSASEPLEILVPASLANTDQLHILLRTDHVASPFRLGVGPDTRQLGLLLHSIELLDADLKR